MATWPEVKEGITKYTKPHSDAIKAYIDDLFGGEASARTAADLLLLPITTAESTYAKLIEKREVGGGLTGGLLPIKTAEHVITDVSDGTGHGYLLEHDVVFGMPPAAGLKSFMVMTQQDAIAGRKVTWSGVRWSEGFVPEGSKTANAVDYYSFVCMDGVHWDGFLLGTDWK